MIELAFHLRWKKHPARKSAEVVKEIAREKRELQKHVKFLEYPNYAVMKSISLSLRNIVILSSMNEFLCQQVPTTWKNSKP